MKPTKNQYYCIACNRTKMIFKSEKSAMNFIKFNAEEIFEETGKAPVRCYYCKICGGWHVTSNPSPEMGERFDRHIDKMLDRIFAAKQRKEEMKRQRKEMRLAKEEQRKAEKAALLRSKRLVA